MRTSELDAHTLTERERKNVSILEAIKRYGPISRTDISKLTKLNIVTVSNYVNNFIEQGIVIEKGLDISSGGRRPTIVVLNPKSAYVIGVDLGVFTLSSVLAEMSVLHNICFRLFNGITVIKKEDYGTKPFQIAAIGSSKSL